jgi:hypothetical protein
MMGNVMPSKSYKVWELAWVMVWAVWGRGEGGELGEVGEAKE